MQSIKPLGRLVFIQANTAGYSQSGLILPDLRRYPDSGWVRAVGPSCQETLRPGDYVVLESEAESFSGVETDFFQITLNDDGKPLRIALDKEAEPVIREFWNAYLANREKDRKITALDIFTDQGYQFLTSDIIDIALGYSGKPDWDLEYIDTVMLWTEEGLFYLIDERNILGVIST